MSPQLQTRRTHRHDDADVTGPWSILPIADTLLERRSSTTTRIGMPFIVPELDDLFGGAERMTGAASGWGLQFWQTHVSSCNEGRRRRRESVCRLLCPSLMICLVAPSG